MTNRTATQELTMTAAPCDHVRSTLIETRGLGGWSPVEVYACDACGHRTEIQILDETHEDEDQTL